MNPIHPNDPKKEAGAKKTPLHLLPPYALAQTALAHAEGARRYGPWNWRTNKVCATTYIGAIKRHLDAWQDGEDNDPDLPTVSHLAKIGACVNILLDAGHCGTLVDDRSKVPTGMSPMTVDEFVEACRENGLNPHVVIEPKTSFAKLQKSIPTLPAREGRLHGIGKVMAEIEAAVEKTVTPPSGFRLLDEGEEIHPDDLFLNGHSWTRGTQCGGEKMVISNRSGVSHHPHVRRINPLPEKLQKLFKRLQEQQDKGQKERFDKFQELFTDSSNTPPNTPDAPTPPPH